MRLRHIGSEPGPIPGFPPGLRVRYIERWAAHSFLAHTAGSNNPACHHKQPNRDWVRGTNHQCWWDNKAHTIESCSES
jgi:hypothetical protein